MFTVSLGEACLGPHRNIALCALGSNSTDQDLVHNKIVFYCLLEGKGSVQ